MVESGYLYYQQALKEKRELQDQWDDRRRYSTSPSPPRAKVERISGLNFIDWLLSNQKGI